jgi:hypothetical protein
MDEVEREYQAIVWIKGSSEPPVRLTIEARDDADARAQIAARFGDQIFKSSVWNEEELGKTWKRPKADNALREYKAIVWPKNNPSKPGQRVTLHARDGDEATKLLEQMFVGTDIVYSLWNEEDANRTR